MESIDRAGDFEGLNSKNSLENPVEIGSPESADNAAFLVHSLVDFAGCFAAHSAVNKSTASRLAGMHLAWFAAEDEGRTEEPTEQKRRKAEEEGRFAKSADLTGAIAMLFGVTILGLLGAYSLERLQALLRFYFSRGAESWSGEAMWRAALSFFSQFDAALDADSRSWCCAGQPAANQGLSLFEQTDSAGFQKNCASTWQVVVAFIWLA